MPARHIQEDRSPRAAAAAAAAAAAVADRLAVAEDAARASGKILLDRLGDVATVETKSTNKDLVTDVDIASGRAAIARILDSFGEDAVLVEEPAALEGFEPAAPGSAEFTWVIDPLDGTTSYVHDFPYFSVSIAVLVGGVPVGGVVYAPLDDECFTGIAGAGARLNGRLIHPSSRASLDEALLITGFAYDRTRPLDRQIRILYSLMRRLHGVRRNGSAALDLCYVAAGRADGYWELEMKDWDLAAGAVILREAGGRITGFDDADWRPGVSDVVASNGALHEALRSAVTAADPGAAPDPAGPGDGLVSL